MIGSLRGTLVHRGAVEGVVDVAGVGYRVTMPARSLAQLPPVGEEVVVHTHLHVREDALALFGFATRDERDVFERLIGANGVGPKLAVTLLSVFPPDELRRVVQSADRESLCLVPGIGPKTATKLLVELRDRLGSVGEIDLAGDGDVRLAEVRAALSGLGYASDEIRAALSGLPDGDGDVAQLVRIALRALGSDR